MAWLHGQSLLHVLECFLVLSTILPNLALASPSRKTSEGVDICRVKAQQGEGGPDEGLRVMALPGNMRAVAFGKADDTETTVACASQDGSVTSRDAFPQGCTAWPEGQEPVSDVSKCPSCACVQDTSKGLDSPSNSMIFEEGIQPACARAAADSPVDVLLFGMGGGAVQTYAMQRCPNHTRVESVEADPRMAAVATKFFGVPVQDGVSVVHVDDASNAAASFASFLNEASLEEQSAGQKKRNLRHTAQQSVVALGKKKWDVLATDCFIDHGVVPESCRSREFLTYLRLLVAPGGTILHHMWHTSPYVESVAATFDDTVELYKDVFGENKVSVKIVPRAKDIQWDSVIFVQG